ncbi:MAG: glycine dehydrogenase (aminomethyl-transferring), partial [Pedobacter sp.]
MSLNIHYKEDFQNRHIAPNEADTAEMLQTVGVNSIDELIEQTVPTAIRLKQPLNLPAAKSETEYLGALKQTSLLNKVFKSFIGQGYYDTITPGVILRNVFENPGWYTQYTPYQAEIAQGRLQALLNFQTMVIDLTGMEIANASLLDEGTAAAEAMFMQYSTRKNQAAKKYFVSELVFPQTIDILKTRANPYGIELVIGSHLDFVATEDFFGAIVQYPAGNGEVFDYKNFASELHNQNIKLTVAADILSLTLLTPPGEWGADIVVGTTQRFGIPMGFGGPHAAFFATKDEYKRSIPGRIIGVTIDSHGDYALRMALQTREQHIRRDKATSNICTAQALLAIMAGFYAAYHGPKGLKAIAERTHGLAVSLASTLKSLGYEQLNSAYFDTIRFDLGDLKGGIHSGCLDNEINLNYVGNVATISIDETTTFEDIALIAKIFAKVKAVAADQVEVVENVETVIPSALQRTSEYLTHPIFNSHHSEHEMLRYIKSLEAKDLSLCHSMIALGSCTMKLNATAEMIPVTWSHFGRVHPFAPADQVLGYYSVFNELDK